MTTYINASTCNWRYSPINPPIIFDVPIPEGYNKDDPFRVVSGASDGKDSKSESQGDLQQSKSDDQERQDD